jgi:hypothetical protein
VVLAGPINEVRSMLTGRYVVPPNRDRMSCPLTSAGKPGATAGDTISCPGDAS